MQHSIVIPKAEPNPYADACEVARQQLAAGRTVADLDPDVRERWFDVELVKLKAGIPVHPALRAHLSSPIPPGAANVASLAARRKRGR